MTRQTRGDAEISPVSVCFMPKKVFVVTASFPRNSDSRVILLEVTFVDVVDMSVSSSCMWVVVSVFVVMEQVCGPPWSAPCYTVERGCSLIWGMVENINRTFFVFSA